MTTFITTHIKQYWYSWAKKRNARGNTLQFNASNLYILPSLYGWAFGIVLLTLLICAINYQISTLFFLAFLQALTGLISAWTAHGNLKNLRVNCMEIKDCHKGGRVKVALFLDGAGLERYDITYQIDKEEKIILACLPQEGLQLNLSLPAVKRGHFQLPVIRFSSYFPFGLFQVWGYAFFDKHYYVYPTPTAPGFWPPSLTEAGQHVRNLEGNEDIDNLKPVKNPWIQANRIAWKIAARGQGWYLKTMNNPESDCWLFSLRDLPAMDIELQLQHLSYWLQAAQEQGFVYGLELKGQRTPLDRGEEHLRRCLQQLALY